MKASTLNFMEGIISKKLYDRISKKQFLVEYNKHLPNKWIRASFRYFSTDTVKEDMWLKRCIQGIAITFFSLGFLSTVFNLGWIITLISTLLFSLIIVGISVFMFGGFIMNNLRIRKIRKALEITKQEYNLLVLYYVEV